MTASVASPHSTAGVPPRPRSDPGRSYLALMWEATSAPLSLVLFGASVVLVALPLRRFDLPARWAAYREASRGPRVVASRESWSGAESTGSSDAASSAQHRG